MKLNSGLLEKLIHFLRSFHLFTDVEAYKQYEVISDLSFKLPDKYKNVELISLFWIAESKKENKLLENFEGLYPYIICKHEKGLTMPEYNSVLKALREIKND